MKRTRFIEEQITYALRQVESGTPTADVCRQFGCSKRFSKSSRHCPRSSAGK